MEEINFENVILDDVACEGGKVYSVAVKLDACYRIANNFTTSGILSKELDIPNELLRQWVCRYKKGKRFSSAGGRPSKLPRESVCKVIEEYAELEEPEDPVIRQLIRSEYDNFKYEIRGRDIPQAPKSLSRRSVKRYVEKVKNEYFARVH
jgi:transposase-like protein